MDLDLRLSSDEQLVVIHDETVSRTTDGRGLVAHRSVAELARLDARRAGPAWPDPQPVPTIARVLEEFPELQHLQLEAKPVDAGSRALMAGRLAALFRDFDLHERATVTGSCIRRLFGVSNTRRRSSSITKAISSVPA